MEKYSGLASIYKNTKLEELIVALECMEKQTFKPEQIVIVIDGPVSEDVKSFVYSKKNENTSLYTIVPSEENIGLGKALALGMKSCRNELIARFDTDDICVLDRCEKQVGYMEQHPDCSVVGANIMEFIDNIENVVGCRQVPETHNEIVNFMKKRCPLNHMAVLFRKSEVEKAGGYQDWWLNEDSYLWARMYLAGCKFYNIQENLVYARVGKEMYARRGGYKYYLSEKGLFKFMYKNKIINFAEYTIAKCIRFVVQVLMPNGIRQWFFKTFARRRV